VKKVKLKIYKMLFIIASAALIFIGLTGHQYFSVYSEEKRDLERAINEIQKQIKRIENIDRLTEQVKKSLESSYPRPEAVALRPIHGLRPPRFQTLFKAEPTDSDPTLRVGISTAIK